MSISPIITFQAGQCETDFNIDPPRIKPLAPPGYLYLYSEDDLTHFCWRPRAGPLSDPVVDLMMVPGDASFKPYLGVEKTVTEGSPKSPVNGRIFVLKFSSSPTRHFFWLQSKEQPKGIPAQFSPRDLRLGKIVDDLLQGGDAEMNDDNATIGDNGQGGAGGEDEAMEDVQSTNPEHNGEGSGGAGADATGGDFREEGEGPREGGADGGRADATISDQTSTAVQNFLNSLKTDTQQSQLQSNPFTTLGALLSPATTVPMLETASAEILEDLLVCSLPSTLLYLEHEVQTEDIPDSQADVETARASAQALTEEQRKKILSKVLRSPQFFQGLGNLTVALSDGGLPSVSDALRVEVEGRGYKMQPGAGMIPISGGDAVEAFLKGIKKQVEKEEKR